MGIDTWNQSSLVEPYRKNKLASDESMMSTAPL